MATFRIAALQKALDESVPVVEMQVTTKKYNELTSKYRDLLQRENAIISRSTTLENLQVCCFIMGKACVRFQRSYLSLFHQEEVFSLYLYLSVYF